MKYLFVIALIPIYISLHFLLPSSSSLLSTTLSKLAKLAQTTRLFSTHTAMASAQIILRPSEQRGHADHGWLKSFHTFSFASYQDPDHEKFGVLRVINEDRVSPKRGFGTHSHREFEIFSYIVDGALEHKDSMGNTEVLKRGDVQLTSAGTGISHSEHTHGSSPVHFLQIWALPSTARLPPKYFTRHFSDADKTYKWAKIVAPVGEADVVEKREAPGPTPVHSPLSVYATILGEGKSLSQPLNGSKVYVHVIQRSGYNTGSSSGAAVTVSAGGSEQTLKEGDGAYIWISGGSSSLVTRNTGTSDAEVLLFDISA